MGKGEPGLHCRCCQLDLKHSPVYARILPCQRHIEQMDDFCGIESVECSTEMEWWNEIVEWLHFNGGKKLL